MNIIPFHDFHRSRHLWTKYSFRSFLYDYRTPMTVIKANLIPSFLFTTRIIIFSSIYAIEGYRTKIIFPIIIKVFMA